MFLGNILILCICNKVFFIFNYLNTKITYQLNDKVFLHFINTFITISYLQTDIFLSIKIH